MRCGVATGHRQRWRDDFALLASLGVNAYRFSLERSAIEPEPGRFSETALALERERVASLRRPGIEPCVTRHHYTRPSADLFAELGRQFNLEAGERSSAVARA